MLCDLNMSGYAPGAPCPTCGHTSMAHPGIHNPGLAGCAICQCLIAAAETADLAAQVRDLRKELK